MRAIFTLVLLVGTAALSANAYAGNRDKETRHYHHWHRPHWVRHHPQHHQHYHHQT